MSHALNKNRSNRNFLGGTNSKNPVILWLLQQCRGYFSHSEILLIPYFLFGYFRTHLKKKIKPKVTRFRRNLFYSRNPAFCGIYMWYAWSKKNNLHLKSNFILEYINISQHFSLKTSLFRLILHYCMKIDIQHIYQLLFFGKIWLILLNNIGNFQVCLNFLL